MKRSFLFVVSFILIFILCSVAFASEITIHNGTTFGMTKEEVKACEDKAGFSYEDVTDNSNYTRCLYNHDVWSIRGKLAGHDSAEIGYHFQNGYLVSCVYQFTGKQFATDIISKLEQKYGDVDKSMTEIALASLIPDSLASHIAIKNGVFYSSLIDVGAWRVPVDPGYSMIITYANFTLEMRRGSVSERYTHVSYELHTDEEIAAAIEKVVTNQQNALDDL